jgi:hypothetical protein
MSTGWWAAGSGIDLAIENGKPFRVGMPKSGSSIGNPIIGSYKAADGGIIVEGPMGTGAEHSRPGN